MRIPLLMLAFTIPAAHAVPVSLTGIFGMGTPATPFTAPGDTFKLTFDLASPVKFGNVQDTTATYTSGGKSFPISPFVLIQPSGEASDYIVATFSANFTGYNIEFTAPQFVAQNSATTGTPVDGVYTPTLAQLVVVAGEAGTTTTSNIDQASLRIGAASVPEADDIGLTLFGFGLLGFAARHRRVQYAL